MERKPKPMRLIGQVKSFTPMLILFLALFLGSLAGFNLCEINRDFADLLAFKREVPWSLVTALFVHLNREQHLYPNLQGLAAFTLVFFTSTTLLSIIAGNPSKAAWRLSWGYVFTALIPHILILTIQAELSPVGTRFFGLSLATFGLYGYSLIITLWAGGSLVAIAVKIWRISASLRKDLYYAFTLVLLSLIILLYPFIELGSFLAFLGFGKPQANVIGHLAAFLAGMVIGFPVLTLTCKKPFILQKI
ncbi:TPA: rhomboid family intramembrane serine protease [Candidatus Bathyarchaeota archaeon]|nr:rhomboid family intramembrane serine protease [Candidatus Bathyarchaeota archaeon]